MPTTFKIQDPTTGRFADVEMLDPAELAEAVHVSATYARRMARLEVAQPGRGWPAYKFGRNWWFHPDHLGEIYKRQQTGNHIPERPSQLGVVVDPDDHEPIRPPTKPPQDDDEDDE